MKILFVSTHFDPFHQAGGAQTRIRNLIDYVKRENDVSLLLPNRFSKEKFDVETQFFPEVHIGGRSSWYFSDFNIWLGRKVRGLVREKGVDLVQASFPWGVISLSLSLNVPVIYDSHNVESEFMKIAVRSEGYPWLAKVLLPPFEKLQERLACKFCDHIISVSPVDMKTYSKIYGTDKDKMTLVPIGVDISRFRGLGPKSRLKGKFGLDKNKMAVVFHGTWEHKPNQAAFMEITERISKRCGDVLFVLAGTGTKKWRRGNVISLGEVGDINKLLSACDIAIVPLSEGSGMRVKILEYFAAGLPVISTEKGIEGIGVEVGKGVIVVDSTEEMIVNINEFVGSKSLRKKIGEGGRKVVESNYTNKVVGGRLVELYRRLANG